MALFPKVEAILARDDMQALASSIPNAVGKITGMLLEAYTPAVLQGALADPSALAERVVEALRLLTAAAPGT